MNILIKNIKILDSTSSYHQQTVDVLVENGKISKIAKNIETIDNTVDFSGHVLSVGFCDLVTQISDPGFEHRDTIDTIAQSALAGGFTAICALPCTQPITQNKATIQYIIEKAKTTAISFYPLAALTQNFDGKSPTEMLDLHNEGAIGFTDVPKSINNAGVLSRALMYVQQFDGLVIEMPHDHNLIADAYINESEISVRLGLKGMPKIAEYTAVYKALEILKYAGGKLHLTGISCKESVELIAKAKAEKINITASCFVHHVVSTEMELKNYNSNYKVFPPLRTEEDRKILIEALKDGTIDCIATQHTPLDAEQKELEFEYASFGMLALESALGLLLSSTDLGIEKIVQALSTSPRNIIQKSKSIELGMVADFIIINPNTEYIFEERNIYSLSKNSPYINRKLKGKVKAVYNKNNFITHE